MKRQGIVRARDAKGWTQRELARRMGVSQQAVQKWENGKSDISGERLAQLSETLGATVSSLLGTDDLIKAVPQHQHMRPVVGRISAGIPSTVYEQSDEQFPVCDEVWETAPDGRWFKVSGHSMDRVIPEGFYVYLDVHAEIRNGDIAVVCVNGEDGTLKRVFFEDDGSLRLHPESHDPEYRDRVIDSNEPDCPPVSFEGKVVSASSPLFWRP